jgi:hypothetical protein
MRVNVFRFCGRRDMRLVFALVLLAGIGGASAQDSPPKPETKSSSPTEVSIQGYGDQEKTCLEWNDGCRTCRRPDTGEAVCSNIGIACQPTAATCTRRTDPPK